ncbi:MAG: hypothetical protein QMD53_04645 [Actinomycetota bacterium]|nr:hypothetical protein [Actinomycetota bacterium]
MNYTAGGAQTVKAVTYRNLTLSGSGPKTLTGLSTINGNLSLSGAANATLAQATTVGGNLTIGIGTTLAGASYGLSVAGTWTNSGTFTAGTGMVTLNGSSAQKMTGATTFHNLTLNNSNGLTISSDETVSNNLTLTSGKVTTGTNKVIIASGGSISGANASRYIHGKLKKNVAVGSNVSRTFEVGTASNYNPVTVVFGSVTAAGNLTAKVTSGTLTGSNINDSKNVNAYWTLTNSGITFNNYGATFTFTSADIDTGATTSNFIVAKRDGSTWTSPTVGTRTSTATQATGMTSFSDFAVGEATTSKTERVEGPDRYLTAVAVR